jgi:enoyl-CoA hydratase/carnithine racemase
MMPRGRRSLHARYTPAGRDGIGRLELTRPEKLNATDDDSVNDLDRAATLAARDKKARAIIVRGAVGPSARASTSRPSPAIG